MKSTIPTDKNIYDEYIKHRYPTFKIENIRGNYIFCNKVPCESCKIKDLCNKATGYRKTLLPVLSPREIKEILKKNPEYGV